MTCFVLNSIHRTKPASEFLRVSATLERQRNFTPDRPTTESLRLDMPQSQSFNVSPELDGKTVLAVLRAFLPGQSWSKIRQRVTRSQVSVNEVPCLDEARRVATGDVVEIHERSLEVPQPDDVRIAYIDPHLVVVEKPSGMMTHRRPEERDWSTAKKEKQPTLEESVSRLIVKRLQEAQGPRGRPSNRIPVLRIVHRLDRDTSGLLVIARSDEAEVNLVSQFRRHTAHRVYWAIVHGHPLEETIESNLVRNRGDGRRGSVNNPKVGQRAVTHVRPLESLGDYSLVECQLETGRTNQIRIHLSERGHLVCGDPKYRQPYAAEKIKDKSGAPRLALHAAELGFIHPITGEQLLFKMKFPNDLSAFYDRLRNPRSNYKRIGE